MIEHWNGSSWSQIPSQDGNATGGNALGGISIAGTNDVWAVGAYNTGDYNDKTLTEHCTPQCTAVYAQNIGTGFNALSGVAAIASNNVWTVGFYSPNPIPNNDRRPLIEHWDGTSWSISPSLPDPHSDSALSSIDYYAPNDIWAVGYQNVGGYSQPLVVHWNGSGWAIAQLPAVNGSSGTLSGVFVTNEWEVFAVGSYVAACSPNKIAAPACATPTPTPTSTPAPTPSPQWGVWGDDQPISPTVGTSVKAQPASPIPPATRPLVMHWRGNSRDDINIWDIVASTNVGAASQLQGVAGRIYAPGHLIYTNFLAVGNSDPGDGNTRTLVENITAPTPPTYSTSRYIDNVSTQTHYKDGYCDAQAGVGGLIVRDYGQPITVTNPPLVYGTYLFGSGPNRYATTNAIEAAMDSYATGYDDGYHGRGGINCQIIGTPQNAIIAIGTSNYYNGGAAALNSSHAQAWATLVRNVRQFVHDRGYSEVVIQSAIDAEPGAAYDPYYSHTYEWVKTYAYAAVSILYNYGSIDGYPCEPGEIPPDGLGCSPWTAEQVYQISWGLGVTTPLPEIYANTLPLQWYQVSRWSILAHGVPMGFVGEMTECVPGNPNCSDYTPSEGWQALWMRLNADPGTVEALPRSTNIQ